MDAHHGKNVRKQIGVYVQMVTVAVCVIVGYSIVAKSERLLFQDLTRR